MEFLQNIFSSRVADAFSVVNYYAARHVFINWAIALVIFLAFWSLRKVFTNIIFRFLHKITDKTKTNFDDYLVQGFEKPLHIFFSILGLYLALSYLPLSVETNLFVSRSFRSGIIILISMGFYNVAEVCKALDGELEQFFNIKLDKILLPFFSKVLKVIIVALAVTIIAQEWDYRVDGFIAGLGLGGLAFSLAAKDSLANVFGGLVIIMDKPFSMGDWIKSPSVEGTVEDINFRSTKVRTFAQAVVTVPNATLANDPVTNWTRMGKRRVLFNLGVTYSTSKASLQKCTNKIQAMLQNHPEVHQDTIFVRFDAFGASSLDILIYFFTNTTSWENFLEVKEDVNFKIMEILEQEGVSVAFPSTSVYFENELQYKQLQQQNQ